MIIYSTSFPGGPYRFDGPEDAIYAKSESGWIDTDFFYVVPERPVILLTC